MESRQRTWPAPSLVVMAVLVLDEIAEVSALLVDVVTVVALDVWVDDRNHLTSLQRNVLHHVLRIRKLMTIPGEVPKENLLLLTIVLYCIVFEHLYLRFSQHKALQKRFLLQLQVAPRKQTGFKKS